MTTAAGETNIRVTKTSSNCSEPLRPGLGQAHVDDSEQIPQAIVFTNACFDVYDGFSISFTSSFPSGFTINVFMEFLQTADYFNTNIGSNALYNAL